MSGWAQGWKTIGAVALGALVAFGVHALCFSTWAEFHRSIDFNREPFEDFMGPYFKQAMAMHDDQRLQPGFLYPPSFALFLKPLGTLSGWAASWIWLGVLALATCALALITLRERVPARPGQAFAWTLILLLSFPWVHDMHWGQVSTLLWAATLGGLYAWRTGRPWWAALGLAAGISIKLFPAWFLIAFAFRKDWAGIARVIGLSVVFLGVAPWVMMGTQATGAFYQDLLEWWQGSLRELFWKSEGSQFAPAVLYRLWNAPSGALAALAWILPLAAALWIVGRVWVLVRAEQLQRGLVLLASALPLVLSPSWSHYFVWLPWGFWILDGYLSDRYARGVLGCGVILMSTPFFLWVGGHPAYPLGGYLTLAALCLPLADAIALTRSGRQTDGAEGAS